MKHYWQFGRPLVHGGKRFFTRFRRYAPLTSFVAGFGWDSFTLSRIDRFSDNMILLAYVVLAGGAIAVYNLADKEILRDQRWYRYQHWYPLAIQFFFGGLFSAYLIYYSQSASFSKADLFLILLLAMFIANEFIRERLNNLHLQMSIYFLICFAFLTFFLPVVTRKMGPLIFTLGGIISLLSVWVLLYFLFRKSALDSREKFRQVVALLLALFIIFNGFYWLNWIPPVPLSLKYGGIYHDIQRIEGDYRLRFEKPHWYNFWQRYSSVFHYQHGDTVFCFTSVFAPTELNTEILHHWQKYNEEQRIWQSTDMMNYAILGGRDGGYRGYTFKKNITPGKWRVDVQTPRGIRLSSMNFRVVKTDSLPTTLKEIIR